MPEIPKWGEYTISAIFERDHKLIDIGIVPKYSNPSEWFGGQYGWIYWNNGLIKCDSWKIGEKAKYWKGDIVSVWVCLE